MDRRTFLALSAAYSLAPRLALAAPKANWRADRTVVLVELAGANDGLNTVVPYKDPLYYRLRPKISVPSELVEDLDGKLGLHPALKSMLTPWEARDMAIVLGVGYAPPNRSHFRSIDIWDTGSNPGQVLAEGWVARVLGARPRPEDMVADAIVLGGTDRAVTGKTMTSLYLRNPDRFIKRAGRLTPAEVDTDNPALKHIAKVQHGIEKAAQRLTVIQARAPELGVRFPRGPLTRQMEVAARLIAAGAKVPVIKVSLRGFDTHRNQPGRHRRLLDQLGSALVAFRAAMINSGSWDRVLVMTYSEFGRRAGENASRGTDHGTAAPHFVLGGRVKGGVYGTQPSLADLVDGDMRHTVDFRRLYSTAAGPWWGLPDSGKALGNHRPIDLLKA